MKNGTYSTNLIKSHDKNSDKNAANKLTDRLMCRQQINRPTDLPSYEGNNDGSKEFQRNSHLKRKDSGRQSLNSDRVDPRIKEKGEGKGDRQ